MRELDRTQERTNLIHPLIRELVHDPCPRTAPSPATSQRDWHVIDAIDVVLGRLAVTAATLLRGKHKPTFAPHMDGGDFVVIVNASKISLGGQQADATRWPTATRAARVA